MNDNLSVFKIWAPDHALWTEWVKPVLFSGTPFGYKTISLEKPNISWLSGVEYRTMIIVDLPGVKGIEVGLALAEIGYRPIPLYNGVKGPNVSSMLVDVSEIEKGLFKGASELQELKIKDDAPPAFLLDSNRMNAFAKQPGKYDNRWCVFPQDMPSASLLVNKGINRVIVRANEVKSDLTHILCRYQEQGIEIYTFTGNGELKATKIFKPPRYKSLMYRFMVTLGLRRNSAGGFGGQIPEPMEHSSSSGYRYYGIG